VPALPVKPEHGPSLPEIVEARRGPRAARVLVIAAAAALLAAIVLVLVARGGGERLVVETDAVTFNLIEPDGLERVDPRPGELVRLEARRPDGLFLQSLVVRPLVLPDHDGQAAGVYPVVAERAILRMRDELEDFRLAEDSRTRINQVPGYTYAFSSRTDDGRRLYGRRYLLVPDAPGERRGVELVLDGTPAAGIPNAIGTGGQGALRTAVRSFRFGTEGP
jgi:hypothetical protein